jgi:uncharacterized protein DUF2829
MFGFGKALDVLRGGDAVRRDMVRGGFVRLIPQIESDTGDRVQLPRFVWIVDIVDDTTYEAVWVPTHEDLLAEDWEYVT